MVRLALLLACVAAQEPKKEPPKKEEPKKEEPKLIAGYELIKPLGEGGIGTVWLVRKPGADRLFVLKIPKADALEKHAPGKTEKPAGASTSQYEFSPDAEGMFAAELDVFVDGDPEAQYTLHVSGTAVTVPRTERDLSMQVVLFGSVGMVLAINLLIGVSLPQVDMAAHLGGLVGGAATEADVKKLGVIAGWTQPEPLWQGQRWRLKLRHEAVAFEIAALRGLSVPVVDRSEPTNEAVPAGQLSGLWPGGPAAAAEARLAELVAAHDAGGSTGEDGDDDIGGAPGE